MKWPRLFLSLALALFSFASRGTGESLQPPALRKFLETLGFENYSAQITQNIRRFEREKPLNDFGPQKLEVLKFNAKRLQIVNLSREIAIQILNRAAPKMNDPQTAQKLYQLTARLLTFQPQAISDDIPPELDRIANEDEREEAITGYLAYLLLRNIRHSTLQIVSDVGHAVFGREAIEAALADPERNKKVRDELTDFYSSVRKYVEATYLDPEMGQTRFLGRALALSLLRASKLEKNEAIKNDLHQACNAQGIFLDNFVGHRVVYADKGGEVKSLEIPNGAFVMEYSGGQEAHQITSAVGPGTWQNYPSALRKKLIGIFAFKFLIPDEEELRDALDAGQDTPWTKKFGLWLSEQPLAQLGYSHVGAAIVKSDSESGVSNLVLMDNYPNADHGGMRLMMGADQFATPGPYIRLGFASYDPLKFLRFAKEQYQKHGYQKIVWESYFPTKEGEANQRRKPYTWLSEISEAEYQALVAWPESRAKEWFNTQFLPRYQKKLHDFMVSDGLAFAYGFKDIQGCAYCANTLVLASRLATNLDLQKGFDHWSLLVKGAKALNLKDTDMVDLKKRIVAPSGFAWQQSLTDRYDLINFPRMSSNEKLFGSFAAPELDLDPALSRLLNREMGAHFAKVAEPDMEGALDLLRGFVRDNQLNDGKLLIRGNYARQAMRGRSGRLSHEYSAGFHGDKNIYERRKRLLQNQAHYLLPTDHTKIEAVEDQLHKFLKNLGFKDYSAQSQAALTQGAAADEYAQETLETNVLRYQIINQARSLSATILSLFQDRWNDPASQDLITDLAGHLASIQPTNPPRKVSGSIRVQKPEDRANSIRHYIAGLSAREIEYQALAVVSDILNVVFGEELLKKITSAQGLAPEQLSYYQGCIKKIISEVETYLKLTNVDLNVGQTRFLGRAMAAGIERESVLRKKSILHEKLDWSFRQQGLELKNFVGSTWRVHSTDKSGFTEVKVHNGSLILSYNYSAEAGIVASAAVPGNKKLAKKMGLTGNVWQSFFSLSDEDLADGLSVSEKTRLRLLQDRKITKGFSHVAIIQLNQDPETKIEMTFILDNMPDLSERDTMGGVRILGLEMWANEGHYNSFAVANYDPAKLQAWALKQYRERGYQAKGVFPAYNLNIDANGELDNHAPKTRNDWDSVISEADYHAFMQIKDPQKWYDEWARRTVSHLSDTMMSQWGLWYCWLTEYTYGKGGGYCSHTINLASLQATGVELQETHDTYSFYVHFMRLLGIHLDKVGLKSTAQAKAFHAALSLPVAERVLAPMGMAAQKHIKNLSVVNYPEITVADMARAEFAPPYVELNPEITELLRKESSRLGWEIQPIEFSDAEARDLAYRFVSGYLVPLHAAQGWNASALEERLEVVKGLATPAQCQRALAKVTHKIKLGK